MERGLLWLPLLFVFFWLAWTGWNEFNKVESYRVWAQSFDKSKYDIYAVLGLKGNEITWGKPNRKSPVDLQTFSLDNVEEVSLLVNKIPVNFDSLPGKGTPVLEFIFKNSSTSVKIPFTEIPLAAQWGKFLSEKALNK